MYRKIVAARTRGVWRHINARNLEAPWRLAAEDLQFTFVGATPLGVSFVGRDRFRHWLDGVFDRFPDITFDVREVVVAGWPWRTRVAVRIAIAATLLDGTRYENEAVQWITLRWGRNDRRLGPRGHPRARRRVQKAADSGSRRIVSAHRYVASPA